MSPIESQCSTMSNQKSILSQNQQKEEVLNKKSIQNFPKIAMIIHSILQLIGGILTITLHCTFLYSFEYFGVKWFNFAIISGIIFLISGTQSFTSWKADLCQDINGDFTFIRCLNGTFH